MDGVDIREGGPKACEQETPSIAGRTQHFLTNKRQSRPMARRAPDSAKPSTIFLQGCRNYAACRRLLPEWRQYGHFFICTGCRASGEGLIMQMVNRWTRLQYGAWCTNGIVETSATVRVMSDHG